MQKSYDGLRSFLAECEEHGEVTVIRNADWNLEIGALTESASELIDEPPALMFDEIEGYPPGFRVLSLPAGSRVRMAIALGLPPDTPKMEIVRLAAQRLKGAPPIPPKEVATGPVMENIMRDNEVDLLKFPVLKSHREDGGRYIGTGCTFLNRDPETGYVNMGTYRMQVHERQSARHLAEPGPAGPADRRALLEAGQGLSGGGDLRGRSAAVLSLAHEISVRHLRARPRRRHARGAGRGHQGTDHRPADPGPCRDRDRRRDAAARCRVAAGRPVRRMARATTRSAARAPPTISRSSG